MKACSTLNDCEIRSGSTVRVLYRLRGGASGIMDIPVSGRAVFVMHLPPGRCGSWNDRSRQMEKDLQSIMSPEDS